MRLLLPFLLACTPVDVDEERAPCPADSCLEGELGSYTIEAGDERDGLCISWTIGNEETLYINALTAENDGWFHHSNWFWVPEEEWDQPDGWWDCAEHGFTELQATTRGGVLFAQSTQLDTETQQFLPGYAVKVPPRSRVVAFAHLLNWSGESQTTALRTRFDLLQPDQLEGVLAPMRFTYFDLDIPAGAETEHAATCGMRDYYETVAGTPFDARLHYVLPHFHGLGMGFSMEKAGGPADGEPLHSLDDAWGHAWGHTFPEPVDLSDTDGIRFACEHDNPTDEWVGWGIGDQEMCVALLFLESELMLDATARETNAWDDGATPMGRSSDCLVIGVPFEP